MPNCIKIDVEDAEHEVLKGAVEMLKQGPPLLIEVHRYDLVKFGSSEGKLSIFLESLGYKEVQVDRVSGRLEGLHHLLFLSQ